jgi:ABC-2 type transport system ATP-binding protein
MISISHLQKSYKNQTAISIDNLFIEKGEFVGLVGNNGAGKTTLLRILVDLVKPEQGEVKIDNLDITKSEEWKNYTGSFLDHSFLIDFLRPEEFFLFIGDLYGFDNNIIQSKLNNYKAFFNNEILNQKNKLIRDFSPGNKQKIGLVSTLLMDPLILILDEPFNFIDPSSQIILKKLLKEFNSKNLATIIISSHNLNFISDLSKRILLLERGKIIKDIINQSEEINELEDYFKQQYLDFKL